MAGKKQARTIFDAYLSGRLSPDTETRIMAWFARYGDHPEPVGALKEIWDETVGIDEGEMSGEAAGRFDRYKELLGFPEDYAAQRERIGRIYADSKRSRRRMTRLTWFRRTAAVVIPLLMLGAAWFIANEWESPIENEEVLISKTRTIPHRDTIITTEEIPAAEPDGPVRTQEPVNTDTPAPTAVEPAIYTLAASAPAGGYRYTELPDRSTVLVNGGGEIAYAPEHREVLLQGEAHFSVAQGGALPFRVKANGLTVTVTGTEFNVDARPDGPLRVELLSGSVEVEAGPHRLRLKPGETLIFDRDSDSVRVTATGGTNWWKTPLAFEGKTLYEIFETIERYYGVRISGKELTDATPYTIKFDKMSTPAQILDVLKAVAPQFEYRQQGAQITIQRKETDE